MFKTGMVLESASCVMHGRLLRQVYKDRQRYSILQTGTSTGP